MHPGVEAAGDGLPVQILLIEDDPGDAFLVREVLSEQNGAFELTWVQTLNDALAAVGPGTDCVLLDLGLPDSVGAEGLRQILSVENSPPVVVVTGLDHRERGVQAVALGAQDYLSKDALDGETLSRSLRYAISRRQAERAERHLREADLLRAENARLERGLLPRPLIFNPQLSWSTRYAPGGGGALLGGDFFDAIELADGTLRVIIGDVCGHGPDEAALGVALRVAWRALVLAGQPPELTLTALDRVLEVERVRPEIFATICDIEVAPDLRNAALRTGGHPSPLLFDGSAFVESPVSVRRSALGLERATAWAPSPLALGEGWTILAYTDGITEGRVGSGGARLGPEGLIEFATDAYHRAGDLEELVDLILAGATTANGGPLPDDVALIALSASPVWRSTGG